MELDVTFTVGLCEFDWLMEIFSLFDEVHSQEVSFGVGFGHSDFVLCLLGGCGCVWTGLEGVLDGWVFGFDLSHLVLTYIQTTKITRFK